MKSDDVSSVITGFVTNFMMFFLLACLSFSSQRFENIKKSVFRKLEHQRFVSFDFLVILSTEIFVSDRSAQSSNHGTSNRVQDFQHVHT